MKELKILYLYPDMLELYGDYGNIQVLKYRIESRGYKAIIDRYSIGDAAPNFNDYDIEKIDIDELINYVQNFNDIINELKKSSNPKLIFELSIIKIISKNNNSEEVKTDIPVIPKEKPKAEKKEVEKQLGDLDDYYALKTKTSKGFIVIKKNGLTKDFVSSEGKVTNLLGVEDITTILE